ncbi:hypothetical protein R75465_06585 [Paraburkholderia aspalathi]|nr:hypothetical protein R75465_06585 [Paraburkholderia aspalathi]
MPHTLRAYLSELRRLVTWCEAQQLGPLKGVPSHGLDLVNGPLHMHDVPGHHDVSKRSVSFLSQMALKHYLTHAYIVF